MQDLDHVDITNTIEDIVNLTDHTNNDDSSSVQIDSLNKHLKDLGNIDITDIIEGVNPTDQTNNDDDLLYSIIIMNL
jgi:hypothetical protein